MDIAVLKRIQIFERLSDDQLARIAAYATEFSASPGEVIMRQNDYSYDVIAIEAGEAEIRRGGRLIARVGAGELVGEAGALGRQLRSATVTAVTPMRLIRLSGWDVRRLERIAPVALEQMRETALGRGLSVPSAPRLLAS
jgi:CRP-like cAMP-binding protein